MAVDRVDRGGGFVADSVSSSDESFPNSGDDSEEGEEGERESSMGIASGRSFPIGSSHRAGVGLMAAASSGGHRRRAPMQAVGYADDVEFDADDGSTRLRGAANVRG